MYTFRFVVIVFFIFSSTGIIFASLSYSDYVSLLTNVTANLSKPQKKAYYLKIYNPVSLLAIRNRDDAQKFSLYTSLKTHIKHQITSLRSASSLTIVSSSASGMTIANVDLSRVRDTWLSLHNIERATKNLPPFTYTPSLEGTATAWANNLAVLGKATHLRNAGDGHYSYASIKQRFIDQGITFATKEKNRQALFTENLGWGYYTCKKTDCTNDFIKAIKTSRRFFMREKGRSHKPHYNAIVGNFSNIGLGVVLTGGKYYLVTHYTQALK